MIISALLAIFAQSGPPEVTFKKTVLDTRFVAEGVAVGDVNRDRKLDILAGNVWYEAPDWKPHEIAPVPKLDPKKEYSNSFHGWTADLNRDGWVDQIVIGMPGEKAIWRENPKGAPGPWKEHLIWRSAGNESPLYEDLFGNGKKVLIMGYDDAHLAWFEPATDPCKEWICHDVSELKGAGSQRYSHGLGVGDLVGDKANEIITTGGYYTFSEGAWTFTKADLGPECAHMFALDVNGDKRRDVLSTSAHARGVWWHEQLPDRIVRRGFARQVIDETISVTHAAKLVPIGKSMNLITGKRKWGHPPGVDIGSEEPCLLVRYELGPNGAWVRHIIDEDSGVGTQFVVHDINKDGRLDIVTSNKNGVFLFEQRPIRG
ncbi:MAG: VCBS repeat-containing protein [Fimbriimonadaceae bacterium]